MTIDWAALERGCCSRKAAAESGCRLCVPRYAAIDSLRAVVAYRLGGAVEAAEDEHAVEARLLLADDGARSWEDVGNDVAAALRRRCRTASAVLERLRADLEELATLRATVGAINDMVRATDPDPKESLEAAVAHELLRMSSELHELRPIVAAAKRLYGITDGFDPRWIGATEADGAHAQLVSLGRMLDERMRAR